MSGLSRQHMSDLSRQHVSALSRQHTSCLKTVHFWSLKTAHVWSLKTAHVRLAKSAENELFSGTNVVAMAPHGPILNDNEAMGSGKVFKYLRSLQDTIKTSKMAAKAQ